MVFLSELHKHMTLTLEMIRLTVFSGTESSYELFKSHVLQILFWIHTYCSGPPANVFNKNFATHFPCANLK